MIMNRIFEIIIVLLITAFIASVSGIALADDLDTPPVIPPDPDSTPTPPHSGGGGGSSYYTPPEVTPTPTPTPVPPYRLDTLLPSKITIGTVPVRIEGTQVSVPSGYLFTDVIKNNTFEAPITMSDGASAKLVIEVEPSGDQTGIIKSMHLIANKTLNYNNQTIGVMVDISLADLPAGSGLSFDLLGPESVDIGQVNEVLSAYSDRKFSPAPLAVFKATKNGLENGKDILGATFTFTMPRPAGFDPSARYYVVRENDGAYDILNATLISSADADPLVFEVVSPRGLSTFSVVKGVVSGPVSTPVPTPTAAPSSTPAPSGLGGGLTGYLVVIGAFVVGAVAGIGVLVLILWLRVR
jgi:hypothetical protein